MNPSLSAVFLPHEVLHSCLSHALSTEHQEVMGLLVGAVNGSQAVVRRSLSLCRRDKRRDRVEVGYEHLAEAASIAEKLQEVEGEPRNVLGWYHSHPHITVMPSHVDVKTQGYYQQLDSNFVGLIFSVFDSGGEINICAFQSIGEGSNIESCTWSQVKIPLIVTENPPPCITLNGSGRERNAVLERSYNMEALVGLQQALLSEVQESFRSALVGSSGVSSGRISEGSSKPSELDICQLSSIYHLSLLRNLDVQLLPTLQGLQSHRRSLERERNRIIKSTNCATLSKKTSYSEDLNNILPILDSIHQPWYRGMQALRSGFTGISGVSVSCSTLSVFSDCSLLWNVRILRTTPQRVQARDSYASSSFASPWSIEISSSGHKDRDPKATSAESSMLLLWLHSVGPGDLDNEVDIAAVNPSIIDTKENNDHSITISFPDAVRKSGLNSELSFWREDLARALCLEFLGNRSNESDRVIDISCERI